MRWVKGGREKVSVQERGGKQDAGVQWGGKSATGGPGRERSTRDLLRKKNSAESENNTVRGETNWQ